MNNLRTDTPTQKSFTVLVVEDEAIVAHDLKELLESVGYAVAGPVDSGEAAIELAARRTPDLLLMDIQLRGTVDGVAAARRCWKDFMLPTVFVTALGGDQDVERAAHPGVVGYIVKPFDERQLLTTLALARQRCVTERDRWKDVWKQSAVADAFARIVGEVETTRQTLERVDRGAMPAADPLPIPELTHRERDVLRLLLDNHRVPAIAELLFISQHTVRNHLKSMFRKAEVRSQAELIEMVRHGRRPPQRAR